jgi:hypothetical protein
VTAVQAIGCAAAACPVVVVVVLLLLLGAVSLLLVAPTAPLFLSGCEPVLFGEPPQAAVITVTAAAPTRARMALFTVAPQCLGLTPSVSVRQPSSLMRSCSRRRAKFKWPGRNADSAGKPLGQIETVETRRAIVDSPAVTDGQLSVQFEHTRAEFTGAVRAVTRRGRFFKIVAGVGAAMMAIGLLATLSGGDDGGFTTIGGCVLAWLAFIYWYCPLAQWRAESLFRGPRRFTFDDDGVGCITELSETRLRWPFYTGMLETERCYVLMRRGRCTPIPKRSFTTPDELERFRALVEAITSS